ncbi:MAG: septal ring lytic transglycosylase RlpA family protein [Bacteroidota bacterium]
MRRFLLLAFGLFSGFLLALHAQVADGIASHYGDGDRFTGATTSTGEPFDRNAFTAACKVFPYGTVLRVTNKDNGLSTQVRVNDCGPNRPDRLIDLSSAAAASIGVVGLSPVRLEVITMGTQGPTCSRGAWSRAGRPAFELDLSDFPVTGSVNNETGTAPIPPNRSASPPTRRSVAGPPVAPASATVRPPVAPAAPEAQPPAQEFATLSPPTAPAAPAAPTTFTRGPQIGEQAADDPKSEPPAPPVIEETELPSSSSTEQEASPQYAVQVAAFGKLTNAQEMIQRLEDAGFDGAFAVKGGNIYRVFSQAVHFRAQADYWKEQLQAAGFSGQIRRIR